MAVVEKMCLLYIRVCIHGFVYFDTFSTESKFGTIHNALKIFLIIIRKFELSLAYIP